MRRKSRDSRVVTGKLIIGVIRFYNDGVLQATGNVRLSHLLISLLLLNFIGTRRVGGNEIGQCLIGNVVFINIRRQTDWLKTDNKGLCSNVGTKWLVCEIRQVEDYLQDDFVYSTIYKIFTRRTHSRYMRFDKVLQRVLSRRSPRHVCSRWQPWNVLPYSSADQLACWSADSHVIIRVDFNASSEAMLVRWRPD